MARALSRNTRMSSAKLEFARGMRKIPTESEALLWQALRGCRLEGWKFRRQQLMLGYIADFYCEEANLCVEVDGSSHRNVLAEEWDQLRDQVCANKGIKVLRISNEDVLADVDVALGKISAMLGGPCPSRSGPRF